MKPSILQSQIPHYREEFFRKFVGRNGADICIYESERSSVRNGFWLGTFKPRHVAAMEVKGVLVYNPMPLLRGYDTVVLPLHFAHLTTWMLLLLKCLHRRKVILWGHGISVKRYLKEEVKPDWKLKLMIRLADGVWTYMEKEAQQWRKVFPHKPIVALNNTISSASEIVSYSEAHKGKETEALKRKYGISQETVLLFCARFEGNIRRTDLLEEVIKRLDSSKYGFVIIGAGHDKPDFSPYGNVYDFGAVYDRSVKQELFNIADCYFQPGWVGLSIVEAMAYGLPVLTFRRTGQTLQCVEYSYIKPNENGMLFSSVNDAVNRIVSTSKTDFAEMGIRGREFVKENLTVDQMVERAESVL